MVWMLGILKAGAMHVPLDLASPAERLRRIVNSCEPRFVLAAGPAASVVAELQDLSKVVGSLQGALARAADGRIAGWFLYYLNGALSQVLQLGARRGAMGEILEQLAAHARGRGARALEGRMEPELTSALRGKRCPMQNRAIWTLLQARDQGLLVPFLRGGAFFSRLDGEWWMRFSGEGSDLHARPQLDHAVGGDVEVVGDVAGVARHRREQVVAP